MARLVGRPKPPNNATEKAVQESRYTASLFVARKKVWEGRAGSYDEASRLANQEKQTKYRGVKSHVVITESPD